MTDLQHLPKKRSLVMVDWFMLLVNDKTAAGTYVVPWGAVLNEDEARNFIKKDVKNYINNEYWSPEDNTKIYMHNAKFAKFIGNISFAPPADSTNVSVELIRNDLSNSTSNGRYAGISYFTYNRSTAGQIAEIPILTGFIPVKDNDYFTVETFENGTGDGSIGSTGGGNQFPVASSWLQIELYDYL